MFDLAALVALKEKARRQSVDWRVLASIAQVESGGRTSVRIAGRDMPLIRWEGHYFWRLLRGEKRKRAVNAGLASRRAGAIRNPKNQTDRYRILGKAKMIDEDAAIQSCSWGIGQVMGAHWKSLGFSSPRAFEIMAVSGTVGQVKIMLAFIAANGLYSKIRDNDLDGFFRVYNGRSFRKWGYPLMYARAWKKWGKEPLYDAMPLGVADLPPAPEPIDAPDDVVEEMLRDEGSRTINQADMVEGSSLWSRGWAVISGGSLAPVFYFLETIPDWVKGALAVAMLGAAIIIWLEWRQARAARAIRAARVDDARTGKNTSRMGGLLNMRWGDRV